MKQEDYKYLPAALSELYPLWKGTTSAKSGKEDSLKFITFENSEGEEPDVSSLETLMTEEWKEKQDIYEELGILDFKLPRYLEVLEIHENNPLHNVKTRKIELRTRLGEL